jgi:ribonucleoside-diphosphate reductase alpha chain
MEFIDGYREANAPRRPTAELEDSPMSTATPMLKVNGHRTATIADLEHAECDNCGALTVRCGTCYRCFNCGNSMGCS